MAHPMLVRAAQLIEQARALNDEFEDKSKMPAEVAQRIDRLLTEAQACRKQVDREAALQDMDSYLHQPEYKHDMRANLTGGGGGADSGGSGNGSKMYAPASGEYLTDNERKAAQRKAFLHYIRKGVVPPEQKADLVEDTDGELLVPADYADTIVQDLPNMSVIRPLAFVRPTSSNRVDVGVVNINQAGWGKLELDDAATDGLGGAPTKETIRVWDLNAMVKIGVDELDDADGDLEAVIRTNLSLKIAEQEDFAFAAGTGDGDKMPLGITQDASITQSVPAALGETFVADELKSLPYAVPQWARRNGVYMGGTDAERSAALLKDGDGRYLFQPRAADGEPATFFGYRWYTNDGFPAADSTADDPAAGTDKSVSFGDWRQGYWIVDRRRLTVTRLTERFADDGKVGLLFRHRVGGGTVRPKAFAFYLL